MPTSSGMELNVRPRTDPRMTFHCALSLSMANFPKTAFPLNPDAPTMLPMKWTAGASRQATNRRNRPSTDLRASLPVVTV